jgi:ribose transport system ATP-binding protein
MTHVSDLGEEALRVENIAVAGEFEDISFSLRRGEILGLYGLIGAGRTEIVESIFGIRPINKGAIYIDGKPSSIHKSSDAVKCSMALVPENRKEDGLVLGMDCKWNIALGSLKQVSRRSVIDRRRVSELFEEYKDKLSIATPSGEQPVKNLSGGNQQKVVIGKWLATNPDILMLDEPTRGIDVGSKAEIHKLIGEFAKAGMAVIIISSEMPEIIGVCSRVITIANGRLTGEFSYDEITEENIMTGIMLH